MNRLAIASIILGLLSCQRDEPPVSTHDTFLRINEEVLTNSRAYSTLREATHDIGHRLTGTENGNKAEVYVMNKLKEYGFDNVQLQEFEMGTWMRGPLEVTVEGRSVMAVALGQSPMEMEVTAEIVDVGNGLEKDYEAKPTKVSGKIALIYLGLLEGTDPSVRNLHRSEKTAIAINHGAVAAMFYNSVPKGVLLTGTASVTGALISIPALCVGKEDGIDIREKLKKGKVTSRIIMKNFSELIKARNIIATVKGTEIPNEKIVLGGHLDSWDLATGAIDNGIGSFAVLDIARAFKANHLTPKRTVEFVLFMGEEQGLRGSKYRVAQAVKDSSINSVKYMMNLDMSGNPIGINAGGINVDSTFFKSLGAEIQKIDTTFSNKYSSSTGLHSDHQPYLLEGTPVLGVISNLDKSVYDCYHANCDNFNLVNETHLRNTARFGTMILYGLANADKLPAQRLDSEATKELLIESHLEEPLRVAGEWKW